MTQIGDCNPSAKCVKWHLYVLHLLPLVIQTECRNTGDARQKCLKSIDDLDFSKDIFYFKWSLEGFDQIMENRIVSYQTVNCSVLSTSLIISAVLLISVLLLSRNVIISHSSACLQLKMNSQIQTYYMRIYYKNCRLRLSHSIIPIIYH